MKDFVFRPLPRARLALMSLAVFQLAVGGPFAATVQAHEHGEARTPIRHVIVLIGENRTFDHLFATYVPKSGDSVKNLLSEGIINADGTPGPLFHKAAQFQAVAPFRTQFFISLNDNEKVPYQTLPAPTLNFSPSPATGEPPPFPAGTPAALLAAIEPSLEAADLTLLTTGASGAAQTAELPDFDSRINNFSHLPNGPFPLAGTALPYDSYTGDTTHRLFEMWQQSDCNIANATPGNPSGCLSDLYPFVITNYTSEPDPNSFPPANQVDDNGGGNSMAFYNMQKGDVPILKQLADQYAMSDNYHQAVIGETSANHVMLGTGDVMFWSDGNGHPTTPPANINDPDPLPGTDNVYTANGFFTECADPNQPGVKPIRDYLASLPYHPRPHCEPGHFYLLNILGASFLPDGALDTVGIANATSLPPSNVRTIGEALNDRNISWAYYGGYYNAAIALEHDPQSTNFFVIVGAAYCKPCNFEAYSPVIMADQAQRTAHIKDATDFFAALDNSTLPA